MAEKEYREYLDRTAKDRWIIDYKEHTFDRMNIKKGHRILDARCGTGADAFLLAEKVGPGGLVVGIDQNEGFIKEAGRRSKELQLPLEFRTGDIYNLPDEDNSYDCTRADRLFHELEMPDVAFRELVRVTRQGGRIVLFDMDWDTLTIDTPGIPLTRHLIHRICDDVPGGWAGRSLFRYFKESGVEDIEITPFTGVWNDFFLADKIFGFSAKVKELEKDGDISETEGGLWLEYLKETGENFFCSLTGYAVCGRKTL